MKTKLPRKLRREAEAKIEIRVTKNDLFKKRSPETFTVYHNGMTLAKDSEIYGGWSKGYDPSSEQSAIWYATRLVGRIVSCKATKLRIEKSRRENRIITLHGPWIREW